MIIKNNFPKNYLKLHIQPKAMKLQLKNDPGIYDMGKQFEETGASTLALMLLVTYQRDPYVQNLVAARGHRQ